MMLKTAAHYAAFLVVFATTIFAARVSIPGTEYSLELPSNYTASQPDGMPNILLHCVRADDKTHVQVIVGGANTTGSAAAVGYENLMQQALPGLSLRAEEEKIVNRQTTLVRRYFVNAGGQPIHVMAAFYSDEKTGFTIHAIDMTGSATESDGIVFSLSSPAPTPRVPDIGLGGLLGGPALSKITLGQSGYTVSYPTGWNPQPAQANAIQYASPDGSALIEVSWSADDSDGMTPTELVDMSLAEISNGVTGNGQWSLLEQRREALPGGLFEYRLYQGIGNGMILEVPICVKYDNRHLFAAYGLYRAEQKATSGAALITAVQSLRPITPLVPVVPASPPPAVAYPPSSPPPAVVVPTPLPVAYRRVDDLEAFTFEVPVSYSGSLSGTQLVLRSSDSTRAGLALVLQQMPRNPGGPHADLKASVETALTQLRGAPSANLIAQRDITVDGQPALWLELTYEAQTGTQRMAQVLSADPTTVYWLGLSGPQAAFNEQVGDLVHAVDTARIANKATTVVVAPRPVESSHAVPSFASPTVVQAVTNPTGFDPSLRTFDFVEGQLTLAHPEGWTVGRAGNVYTYSGVEGTTAYYTTMNLQLLDKSAQQNRDLDTARVSFGNGFQNAGGKITGSQRLNLKTCITQRIDGEAMVNGALHHFRYLLIDRPQVIAVISFVAPIEMWSAFEPLTDRLKASIRPLEADNVVRPAVSPTPAPAPVGRSSFEDDLPNPSSPQAVFDLIQRAVRAKDWVLFVHLLDTKTVEIEMQRYLGELAREHGIDVARLGAREAMLAVLQTIPEAAESKAFLGKNGTISGTRKEDENRELVMVRFEDGSEQYLWMFRENGNWRWHYQ